MAEKKINTRHKTNKAAKKTKPAARTTAASKKVKDLEGRIQKLTDEYEKQKILNKASEEKYLRLQAEYSNFKRRNEEEKTKLIRYAGKDLANGILPAMDDLLRSIDSTQDEKDFEKLSDGISMVVNKLQKALENQGIKPFESVGEKFDAELHNALMAQPSDEEENTVLQEIQKGYKYRDRILRHATVIVSKAKDEDE